MKQKYDIYNEAGWDEENNSPKYKHLTTMKNERSAIDFISDYRNIGKYGNMKLCTIIGGKPMVYHEGHAKWLPDEE